MLSGVTRVLLGAAFVALAAGALFGVWVAYPVIVPNLNLDELKVALDEDPMERPVEAHLRRASRARLNIIKDARAANATKALWLRVGLWCAGAGIVLLLAAVILALSSGSVGGVPGSSPTP